MIVSGNFFSVLGAPLPLGRAFLPEEDLTAETHPVAVISQSLWQRSYGGTSSVIGTQIILNDKPFTIIGVAPPDVPAPGVFSRPDVWVPMMMHETILPTFRMQGINLFFNRGTHWLGLMGRMREGVEREGLLASLRATARRIALEHPDTNGKWTVAVVPVNEARLGSPSSRTPVRVIGLLGAVVGMVLLIACANVANLLLARGELRRREMAIRLSLGAGRGRLIRQLITESLLLSLTAGVLGLFLASWSGSALSELWATVGPGDPTLRLDGRVLTFTLVLATVTGLTFGIIPAIQASAEGVAGGRGHGVSGGNRGNRQVNPQRVLVALQVAFSIVLLAGAGLTLRTVWNLRTLSLGFDVEGVNMVMADPYHGTRTREEERRTQENLLERIRQIPGVQFASLTYIAPLSGQRMANDIVWDGSTAGDTGGRMNVDMNLVDVGFFETLGIRLLQGRSFSQEDLPGAEPVAVVNEALAARLWPNKSALGKSISSVNPSGADWALRVVGVVENGRYYRSWRRADRPFVFLPLAQQFHTNVYPIFRNEPGGGPSREAVLQEVTQVAPGLRHPRLVSLESAMADSVARERTTARLLILFGALALTIAGIGVYGVSSFSVTRRNHELGVRIALGARGMDVGRQVARESVLPVLAGALVGFLVTLALGRFVEGLLFGVHPHDPLTLTGAAVIMSLIGILATLIPAKRAAGVNPLRIMNADG
jgi:predicted permease